MHIESIKRETEKAVLVTVEVENCAGRRAADFWFPRSQIKIEGNKLDAPVWLVRAKLVDKFGAHVGSASWIN